jgi:cell division protein ZapA
MSEAAVQLKVAGKTYSVVTSAAPEELRRLAEKVEDALVGVSPPGREPSAQALVLAAITLAHELEEERAARVALEERHRKFVQSMIMKVDAALGEQPEAVFVKRGTSQFKKSRSV